MSSKVSSLQARMDNTAEARRVNTGYWENWAASLGRFVDEDMSISEYVNSGVYEERNREIDQLFSENEQAFNIGQSFKNDDQELDYVRAATALKKSGFDINDDIDVTNKLRSTLKRRREYTEDIENRASLLGHIGQFAGTLHGAMIDPVNAATMLLPALALARGASAISTVGRYAAVEGSLAMASEAVIQGAYVYDWKNKIGAPNSVGEALGTIVLAGAGGATLGGLLGGVSQMRFNAKTGRVIGGDSDALDIEIALDTAEPEIITAGNISKIDTDEMEQLRIELDAEARYNRGLDTPDEDVPLEDVAVVIERINSKVEALESEVEHGPDWSDFDDDSFMELSDADRDEYINSLIGDQPDPEDLIVYMEDDLVEGQYAAISREDYLAQEDEIIKEIDEFKECWAGG